MADNTTNQDDSKAKATDELAKPGRYIVGGNVVDANGKVICEAPKAETKAKK